MPIASASIANIPFRIGVRIRFYLLMFLHVLNRDDIRFNLH